MSDVPPGPGYWKASDGNWYPPEAAPGSPASTLYGPSPRDTAWVKWVVLGVGLAFVALVSLIVAISFLGSDAKSKFSEVRSAVTESQDRSAQSRLRQALVIEKIVYGTESSYTVDTAKLAGYEPRVTWTVSDEPASGGTVSVALGSEPGAVYLSTKSEAGRCFYIRADGADTSYANDEDCRSANEVSYGGQENWSS